VLKNDYKKYAKVVFIGLATYVTEAVFRSRFGEILKLKNQLPMSLFHQCIRSFSSDVQYAFFLLAVQNVTKVDDVCTFSDCKMKVGVAKLLSLLKTGQSKQSSSFCPIESFCRRCFDGSQNDTEVVWENLH
jgi:hypothetical protein